MIDPSLYIYYILYAVVFAIIGVCYLKMKSTEPLTITTKEFKDFQSMIMTGYTIMILGELVSIGSFYQTMILLELKLDKVTRLYVVTIISTTVFGLLSEIIDFGSRRNKCIVSAIFFTISMLCILFSSGHFDLLMLSRVIYGVASSLLHSAFDAYLVQEHSSLGFPEDWLNQTFSFLTHSMALVSCLSGVFGQTFSTLGGTYGPVGLCCGLFSLMTLYIAIMWKKDLNGPKFLLSGFLSSWSQAMRACRTNKQIFSIVLVSSCSEASITIFTFYWAPWLASVVIPTLGSLALETFPFPLIFSTYIASSMVGAYMYQLFIGQLGNHAIFQLVLVGSTVCYFLGSIVQTPVLVFSISLVTQLLVGAYWPCIGFARGRVVSPELRSSTLCATRLVTLAIVVPVLSGIHHAPGLVLGACSVVSALAAYLQMSLAQGETSLSADADEDSEYN